MICFANMQIEVLDNFFCKMMLWTIVWNCDNFLYYESLQIHFLQLLQFLVGVSFLANLINCGSGKFVCKINKLLLRTPFLHVVQMFGFGHLFFGTFADSRSGRIFCKLSLWTTFCLSFTTFQYILLLSLLSSTDKIFYFVKCFVSDR